MRILILSCNTGAGHNSAAAAMKEYFESVGVACEIRDALAFKSEMKSKIISRGHVLVYQKAPLLFGAGYRFLEQHPPKHGQSSVMYDFIKSGAENLYVYLSENRFDLILCTHLFASIIVTEMQKKFEIKIRNYLITTDYTCYPGVNEVDIDGVFIPHENLISEYRENGIPLEKIIPAGIPVKKSFYEKGDSRLARKTLGISEEKKLVLMMCGSMGCGPLPELAALLSEKMPPDTVLAVICGSNEKLLERFRKMNLSDRVSVIGYTDKISLYMDAATVILTKPGGLSATESAAKGLPMVLIDAVPGCETKNMDFFTGNGFALTSNTAEGLADAVCMLLSDDEKRESMTKALRAAFSSYAAKAIGETILSEMNALKI